MRFPTLASLMLLFVCTGLGLAQDAVPIFRVTSSRVIVEFIAVDKSGRFVSDLDMEEIEIFVDGKKQKLDRLFPPGAGEFAAIRPQDLAGLQGSGAVPPGTAGTSRRALPSSPARTAIVLDTRVLDASNFSHSVSAIRAFIGESLASDHLVMIAEVDRSLKIVAPFTRERAALLEAVDSLRPATVYNALDSSRLTGSTGPQYIDDLFQQVTYLRSGLRRLCHALSGAPGRKHVVFFSEGYPLNPVKDMELQSRREVAFVGDASTRQAAARRAGSAKDPGVLSMVNEIVTLANGYGISFYTVDARGLIGVPGLGADVSSDVVGEVRRSGRPPGEPRRRGEVDTRADQAVQVGVFKLSTMDDINDAQNTLLALAAGTNGSAFLNSNDLQAVLHASTVEQRNVYMASFVPKVKKRRGRFHKVRVRTNRKDVLVRSQAGFLDLETGQLSNARLAMAFESPDLFRSLSPILKIQTAGGKPQAVLGVPGTQITSRPKGDLFEIEILFLGQIFDARGKPVSKKLPVTKGFRVDLTRDQFQSLAQQPLYASQILDLPRGKYRLVLVVEDRVSGSLGTTEQEFSVP